MGLLGRIYSVEVSHCDHSKKYFHKLLLYAKMVITSPTFMLFPCENDNDTPPQDLLLMFFMVLKTLLSPTHILP